MNINKVLIAGRLVRDPELKTLPNGTPVANFTLATNSVYTDKNGSKQEEAEYHSIVVFGKVAENCARYLLKGQEAYVEGKMKTRTWEKDGEKKYKTEIVAQSVQFGQKVGGSSTSSPKKEKEKVDNNYQSIEYPEEDINPDDIPF